MTEQVKIVYKLEDFFSNSFSKMKSKADTGLKQISTHFKTVDKESRKVAHSIEWINDELNDLKKRREINVDVRQITALGKQISHLEREKAKLEGMGNGKAKGLMAGIGIVGGLMAAGAAVEKVGSKAYEATVKYQKFEAILDASFGNKMQAGNALDSIIEFAVKTPYEVEELTTSFIKLRNRGFTPTLKEMTSMGDLASSQGKKFDQYAEAMLGAEVGYYRRLKEFGINAKAHGDKMTFTFRGVTTVTDKSQASIRKYLLSLGDLEGVQGTMGKIMQTTGGKASNFRDELDLLFKTIGERGTPSFNAAIAGMTSLLAKTREWIEIPASQKTQDMITHIRALYTEMTTSDTSSERRISILKELKEINPDIVKGIDEQKISYGLLADNVDRVTTSLKKKIEAQVFEEKHKYDYARFDEAKKNNEESILNLTELFGKYVPNEYQGKNYSMDTQISMLEAYAQKYKTRISKEGMVEDNPEYMYIMAQIGWYKRNKATFQATEKEKAGLEKDKSNYYKNLGISDSDLNFGYTTTPPGGAKEPGKGLGSGVDNIVGDIKAAKNVIINLEALVKDVKNIFPANATEQDLNGFMEILKKALLQVLNDANMMVD